MEFRVWDGGEKISANDRALLPGYPRGALYPTVLGRMTSVWTAASVLGDLSAKARAAGVPLRGGLPPATLVAGGVELLWREVQKHHHLDQGEGATLRCRETITYKPWLFGFLRSTKTEHAVFDRTPASEGGHYEVEASWADRDNEPHRIYRPPRDLKFDVATYRHACDGTVVAISSVHLRST
ncbi:hypothetical protein [Streptomyces sp. NBC_00102]|uniref:hypothetical protein n=1 Tax=Streptomyces sp. NBC_00102 TaxID=2975652 RepID=UPI002256F08C|nr:hypothetical protein [Streptomyces sp. NBC_00102]MCX5402082.1 hypothetical protein [Streptomyces sp. NBC_00102]